MTGSASQHRALRLARAYAALAAAAACSACGGASRIGVEPSWRTTHRRDQPGPAAGKRVFSPSGRAAEAYNAPPYPELPHTPLIDALVAEVDAAATAVGKAPPRADGRLFKAVQELAELGPADEPPPDPVVEFAMQRQGIIEPLPHLLLIQALDGPGAIDDALRGRLRQILRGGRFARFGIGVVARRGSRDVMIAFQESYLHTSPIPRTLPRGGHVEVTGSVEAPFANPEILLTGTGGRVAQVPVTEDARGELRATLSCGNRRGRQEVEISADDASGSTVLANFPVWCGERPPPSIAVAAPGRGGAARSAAQAEARMVRLINRDRARYGVPLLQPDPRLAAVARAHSREMRESGVVAHVSPTTGSPGDRVRAAGLESAVVLENIARAYSAKEAELGFMNSPGHRANLLSKQVTNVGVGIVFGKVIAGRHEMFVTQLFTLVPPIIDPIHAAERVEAAIRSRRALPVDPTLTAVARQFARDVARGASAKAAEQQATRRVRESGAPYTSVTSLVSTVADVASFDPKGALSQAGISHFGVGVAQGHSDIIGDRAIFIVVLLGFDN